MRLRLPHVADAPELRALHRRLGSDLDEDRLGRILRFDPRHRTSVLAMRLESGIESIVGYGHLDSRDGGGTEIVVADEVAAPGVLALLRGALAERAVARFVA